MQPADACCNIHNILLFATEEDFDLPRHDCHGVVEYHNVWIHRKLQSSPESELHVSWSVRKASQAYDSEEANHNRSAAVLEESTKAPGLESLSFRSAEVSKLHPSESRLLKEAATFRKSSGHRLRYLLYELLYL